MAARSPLSLNSEGELLSILQNGQVEGQTAQWLKSNLIVLGPQTAPDEEKASEEDPLPTLYSIDCLPSLRNFMIVAWNRLFRYPHAIKHVNGVIHGLHASSKSTNFDTCLREALRLFGASKELSDSVKTAREGLKWALESSWRTSDREAVFRHRTEAISSVQLLFDRRGAVVGARLRLHWLSDSSFLVDPFEENSPTFALLQHFIAWIQRSDRELDPKIVGRNLKRIVENLDTEPGSETLFRDVISVMHRFGSQERFMQLLQVLASFVQLQRVRAKSDQDGSISLFNPDGLSVFGNLLGADAKELRYQLLTDVSKTKMGSQGTKDPDQVNQDVLNIAVVLYRSLMTWLFDMVNKGLFPEEHHAAIELFDMPGLTISLDDADGSYDVFCKNAINDVMTFSAFEKRNEDRKKILMREGISLDPERPQYDDYLNFYFTQGKTDSLLSILSQEKTKKDHIQRLKKQIFANFKTNQRIVKMKQESRLPKDTVIGIRHASEETVCYNLEQLHAACSAVVPSGLNAAIGDSRHPVSKFLSDYRNTVVGLAYTRGALMALSEKIVSEKSLFIYCLPVLREGALVDRQQVRALHLFNQCLLQISDFSEVISHRTIFENYTHIFFLNSDGLKPSQETTRKTLDKLHIFGYISAHNVFLCEADFFKLEDQLQKYKADLLFAQKIVRGFIARRRLKHLKEEALSYRSKLMSDFERIRKASNLFRSIQLDYINFITEETDSELLLKLLRKSEGARRNHRTAWGFCFVYRFGKQVAGFPLTHDLYWIFAKPPGEVTMEKNYVNLCSFATLTTSDETLCDTFRDGFYFRKTSNNSLSVKRKTIEPLVLWSATKSFRRTSAPFLREHDGLLPYKKFADVFSNEQFKTVIAQSLHTKEVSSRAIVGECIIPLIVGSVEKHTTISEAPYCFVIVDLSIKDSLCLETFNRDVREEVKRLKKVETAGDPKKWGRQERKDKSDKVLGGGVSIHTLLIKMDRNLMSAGSEERLADGLSRTRKKEKWSRKAYEKKKMADRMLVDQD